MRCCCQPFKSAREAARRRQCTNNIKQLGLAALNYESAAGVLPGGSYSQFDPFHNYYSANFSCFVHMLPYFEQQAMYNATNFNLTRYNVQNITIAGVKVASLSCPTRPDRFVADCPQATVDVSPGWNFGYDVSSDEPGLQPGVHELRRLQRDVYQQVLHRNRFDKPAAGPVSDERVDL